MKYYIDGKQVEFIKFLKALNSEKYALTETKTTQKLIYAPEKFLRKERKKIFQAFDIYKQNVNYGIESETESEHTEIITWYQDMLDLKEEAFENIPEKVKKYLT